MPTTTSFVLVMISVAWYWSEMTLDGRMIVSSRSTGWKRLPMPLMSGPDISGVGNRFQPLDLLEAIVLPSKIISDQYQATEIITKKKDVHVGTIHEENDQQVVIRPSPLSTNTETVKKDDINIRRPSKISIMPTGLIDVLKEDEVLDLLAYLRSAGDPKDPAFRKQNGDAAPTTAASAK